MLRKLSKWRLFIVHDEMCDTDARLMLRFAGGDNRAFDELVRRNWRQVIQTIQQFFQDEALAEDLCQEVFLRVCLARDEYEPRAKFSTWLHRIAVNVCINEKRRTERLARQLAQYLTSSVQASNRDQAPEAAAETAELVKTLAAAIRYLPPRQQQAVMLYYYEGKSRSEIAAHLNCSVAAVDALLHRARTALRKHLSAYLEADNNRHPGGQ